MLGIGGGQPAQHGAQHPGVEGVHAGIDLADRGLLRSRVGVLDDFGDLTVGVTHDPAVAVGIVGYEGEDRDSGALGIAAMLVEQGGEGVPVQQRDIPGRDDDVTGEIGGQSGEPHLHGVPGAQLLLLHHRHDLPVEFAGHRGRGRPDLLPVVAHHRHQMARVDGMGRVQRVRQHAAPGERVQHLGCLRPHSRTGTCG